MLIDSSVDQFLTELASGSPAPGGGSVAALAGSLGAALVAMVCRLTVDKPKYADVSEQLHAVLAEAEDLGQRFAYLVERDTEAFNAVMAAFRMPKETEDLKRERSAAIQRATRGATEVPLEVHTLTVRLLELSLVTAAKGNVNSVSDAGVAADMARACAHGAYLNVQINLGGLKDENFVAEVREKLATTYSKINALYDSVAKTVEEKIS
ncbi:cyclodeaminase/cyclohydrolase family protein [Candidatus Zixiibacteriota bacterium]